MVGGGIYAAHEWKDVCIHIYFYVQTYTYLQVYMRKYIYICVYYILSTISNIYIYTHIRIKVKIMILQEIVTTRMPFHLHDF